MRVAIKNLSAEAIVVKSWTRAETENEEPEEQESWILQENEECRVEGSSDVGVTLNAVLADQEE